MFITDGECRRDKNLTLGKDRSLTHSSLQAVKLGLIGDNIQQSKSPLLHRAAGLMTGLGVTYELLIPRDMGLSFDDVFEQASALGFRGVNITYPYKEAVAPKVTVVDPFVRCIGAVNTVVFDVDGPKGFNTDYTGFLHAYHLARGKTPPGVVCLIGTGGVGKAVAFGLLGLGAQAINCVDLDPVKAANLVDSLVELGSQTRIAFFDNIAAAVEGADGIINCTPLGMNGIGGSPLPANEMQGAEWVFDAVYTPADTEFLQNARLAGLTVISGYQLFIGQGVDAWEIFTGTKVDRVQLTDNIQGH